MVVLKVKIAKLGLPAADRMDILVDLAKINRVRTRHIYLTPGLGNKHVYSSGSASWANMTGLGLLWRRELGDFGRLESGNEGQLSV